MPNFHERLIDSPKFSCLRSQTSRTVSFVGCHRNTCRTTAWLLLLIMSILPAGAQDTVFSGPQVGEKLPSFEVKGILGAYGDQLYDPLEASADKPILLMFFHQKTRPAFGLCRAIAKFVDGLSSDHRPSTHLILLTDDPPTEEKWAKTVVPRYLPEAVQVAVSQDGQDGPGAYGLNRHVTLTIVVGKDGRVTKNFALVQPQLRADGPGILQAIGAVTGVKELPDVSELDSRYAGRNMSDRKPPANQTRPQMQRTEDSEKAQQDPKLAGLLRRLINRQATEEQVEQVVTEVEAYIRENASARRQLRRIVSTIMGSQRLENYGTKAAQKTLQRWHDQLQKDAPENRKEPDVGEPLKSTPEERPSRP